MISDSILEKIIDDAIAEGRIYSNYAWHYVGEDTVYEIIGSAIVKAIREHEKLYNKDAYICYECKQTLKEGHADWCEFK